MNYKLSNILIGFLAVFTIQACCCRLPSKTNHKDFESSGSMCLDALFVNLDASGCVTHETVTSEDHLKVSCSVYRDDASPADPWLINVFYVFQPVKDHDLDGFEDYQVVCLDSEAAVFIKAEKVEEDFEGLFPFLQE